MMTTQDRIASVPPAHPLPCPRCGYDQRGVVETWTTSCPVDAECAECGLAFRWSTVLQPERFEPPWCFEYAWRRPARPFPPIARTILRSLNPVRFWRSLDMSNRWRPRRLSLFAFLMLAVLFGSYAIEQGLVAWRVRFDLTSPTGPVAAALAAVHIADWQDLVDAPDTRHGARVAYRKYIERLNRLMAEGGPRIEHGYPAAILEAILKPRSTSSRGMIRSYFRDGGYPAPASLHTRLLPRTRFTLPLKNPPWVGAPLALGVLALMPFAFALIPVTRRRCHVRSRHIARIAVYSMVVPVLCFSAVLLLVGTRLSTSPKTALPRWPIWILATFIPLPFL